MKADPNPRKRLFYTFGNHMHWVDMEWLWGYSVLPDSIDDMIRLIGDTGAKGNLNFDAVGYEKLAAENPAALEKLRHMLAQGNIEIVGASYGQPYGIFHGGESNLRQRIYGIRSVLRLLGVRPRVFWEEEFDFFPQLPQLLLGCGFHGACLFFQWTWHTPHLPQETEPFIWWQGMDGSRIAAISKHALCLHQWPEDFVGRLDEAADSDSDPIAVVQWLELMPSPDWMCRSELLIPPLKTFQQDPRFDWQAVTLGEMLAELQNPAAPVRAYRLDQVFHGMTLGKNGDRMPRWSHRAERSLLHAEALSVLCGGLGRPYPSWSVYPTWELEESWRELLAAQHHDNHECEALCGFVGRFSFERSFSLSQEVLRRSLQSLAKRLAGENRRWLAFNPCGFTRDVALDFQPGGRPGWVRQVPAFGYRAVASLESPETAAIAGSPQSGFQIHLQGFEVEIDARGQVKRLDHPKGPSKAQGRQLDLGGVHMRVENQSLEWDSDLEWEVHDQADFPFLQCRRRFRGRPALRQRFWIHPQPLAFVLETAVGDQEAAAFPRPDPGYGGALQLSIRPDFRVACLRHDHPFAISEIRPGGSYQRKYPTGDWMTSPQWFETVKAPFSALSLVDLLQQAKADSPGWFCIHDGAQGFLAESNGVRQVLQAYDPWDEDGWHPLFQSRLMILPHQGMNDLQRWQVAEDWLTPGYGHAISQLTDPALGQAELPVQFCGLHLKARSTAASALYRESQKAGEHLPDHFVHLDENIQEPFVLRVVERMGFPDQVELEFPGELRFAALTNHLGEVEQRLVGQSHPHKPGYSLLRWQMKPFQVRTVYLDSSWGRHQARHLDQHRQVWATVHRRKKP